MCDSNHVDDSKIVNFFNNVDFETYLGLENSSIFQDLQKTTIQNNLPNLKGKRAYEVGFGTGFCLKILLGRGLQSYTGLDVSLDMGFFLKNLAQQKDSNILVNFIQGDATDEKTASEGRYDFVISTFSMYVNSYEKLLRYATHLFKALDDNGELHLMVLHTDFIHNEWREKVLDSFNNYFFPKLKNGERYEEFSKIKIVFTPPYLQKTLEMDEYVVGKNTLIKALNEAGFTNILELDMICKHENQQLLDLAKAVGMAYYKCKKY